MWKVICGLVACACGGSGLSGVDDPATLEKIQSAAGKREQLCASFGALYAATGLEQLKTVVEACAVGDSLQAIARAAGNCYQPATSGGSSQPGGSALPPTPDPAPEPPAPAAAPQPAPEG